MRELRLGVSIAWFEAQRFAAFPFETIASLVGRLTEAGLFIVFWLVVGSLSSSGQLDPIDLISYYLIATGISPFFYLGFGIGSEIIKLIKRGELNQLLLRPTSPLVYPWAVRTGRNAINILFAIVQVAIGIVLAGGISFSMLPFLLPVLFNALLINAALNMMVGTAGFYLVEATGVKNATVHVARLLRGELMPLYLMPAGIASALQLTPFPASQYHLTILLQGTHELSWGVVLIGSLWAVLLMAIAIVFWKRGLRLYEAVGI